MVTRAQQPSTTAITRRAVLAAFALLGFAARAGAGTKPLGAIARRAGLSFGTCVQARSLDDVSLAKLLADQCTSITPELELKWAALSPHEDAFDTAPADRIAAFAKAKGLALRGHTLLWQRSLPPWLSAKSGWSAAGAHIAAVMARYGSAISEWDVVNEPIDGAGLRAGPLVDVLGADYIEKALHAAHEAAPRARLIINEYGLEYATSEQANRRRALLALITSLQRRGAPLHGIGIQGHLEIGRGPLDVGVLGDFLKAIADLGLSISITELDVKERDYILPVEQRDAAVSEHVARFLDIALAQPAVRSLTCWGLSDRQSWLEVTEADYARYPGAWADGTSPGLNRGLPYDAALQSKPMRAAVAGAMLRRRR